MIERSSAGRRWSGRGGLAGNRGCTRCRRRRVAVDSHAILCRVMANGDTHERPPSPKPPSWWLSLWPIAHRLLLATFGSSTQRIVSIVMLIVGLALGGRIDWTSIPLSGLPTQAPPAADTPDADTPDADTQTMYSYYFAGNDGPVACYEEEMSLTFHSNGTVEGTGVTRLNAREWDYTGVVHGNNYYLMFESTPETRSPTAGIIHLAPFYSGSGEDTFAGFWFGDDLDYDFPVRCPWVMTNIRRPSPDCNRHWPDVFNDQTCVQAPPIRPGSAQ